MNIYIAFFIYFTIIAAIDNFGNRKISKVFFFLSFLILIFWGGFRFDTGWDYEGYKFYYAKTPSFFNIIEEFDGFSQIYFEPGFKLLMSLLKSIGGEFQELIFIVNFITTSLFFLFIRRVGMRMGYENLMVLLYFSTVFLYTNFSVLRQGIAVGIWLFSLNYIFNRKFIKHILYVLLGCMFHYSLSLFLVLPFLLYMKPKQKLFFIIIVVCLLIYVLNIRWITSLSSLFPDVIFSKLQHYWEQDRFGSARTLGFGFFEKLLFLSSMIYLYFFRLNKSKGNWELYVYVVIYLFYFICYLLFFELTILYDRTRLYFASYAILVFPFIIFFLNRYSKWIVFLFSVAYSIFMFMNIISSEQNRIVFIPYHSVFENEALIPDSQKGRLRTDAGISIDHKD